MRESFDLSYATACLFDNRGLPELLRVDQVLFMRPVPVGSLLQLKSKVTCVEEINGKPIMRVVTKGFNEKGEQTGNCNFLF